MRSKQQHLQQGNFCHVEVTLLSHSEKRPHQIGSFFLCMVAPWVSLRVAASGLTDTSKAISLHLWISQPVCASHPPGRQHMLPFSTLYVFRLQTLCQQCKDLTHTAGEFATCPVPPCLWSWPVPSSFIPPWEVSKSLANTGALTVPWGARATLVHASGERRPALTDWEWSHGDLISVPSSDHLKEIKKGAEQPVYAHLQSASLLKQ